MTGHIVYISVGSNLGDTYENCQNGIAALTHPNISVLKGRSRFYQTEPVDYKEQDWFINGVVKIETALDPESLLHRIKQIEVEAGRKTQTIRFGPRILDLDILIYDDVILDTPLLKIPHPRMHKRRFVLRPFCDIDPDKKHPVLKKDMKYLLNHLNDSQQKVIEYRCDS